ncbi:hypothetical protein E4T56_gene19311 [Termitomyces sp. T112]|nr:hypothetical protein E4T56_gene19311 [Termitomyces sp. T112]
MSVCQVMGPANGLLNAASSSSGDAFKFLKLNGKNYALWAEHMKATLQSCYLWLIVTGNKELPSKPSSTKPEGPDEATWRAEKKEYLEWTLQDQAVQGLMKSVAESSQWPHVADKLTAKAIWDGWKAIHIMNQQKINVHYYFKELYTWKYADSTSMADHIAAMLNIKNKITVASKELPNIYVAHALILSLPHMSSWDLIKIQLFGMEMLTSKDVLTQLQAEYNCQFCGKESETALLASKKSDGKKKGQKPKADDKCHYCKSLGHWINKCPKHIEDEKKKKTSKGSGVANLTITDPQELCHEPGQNGPALLEQGIHEAWTGQKLNISHLQIFGSIAYANIPKKLHGGKLGVTSVKCCMLGWWTNETKGYRLKDVKTGKLITARDICFVEDNSPGDLAEFEMHGSPPSAEELAMLALLETTNTTPVTAATPANPVPKSTKASTQETVPAAPEPTPTPTASAPKASKWFNLPLREHPMHTHHQVKCYGIMPVDDKTSEEKNSNQHRAYVAFEGTEPKTYCEAASSTSSRQWEEAIATKYKTLQKTGTFEWVPTLPEGQKAVGSCIVFHVKHDGNGGITKYKAQIVVKGFLQVYGQNFMETFSSIAKFTTL